MYESNSIIEDLTASEVGLKMNGLGRGGSSRLKGWKVKNLNYRSRE